MSGLSRERWQAVSPHLDRALELAGDERARVARVAPRAGSDPRRRPRGAPRRTHRAQPGRLPRRPRGPPALRGLARRPDDRRLHAGLAHRPGRHGQRLARPAQRRPLRGQAAVKLLNASLVGRAGEERFRARGQHPRAPDASRTSRGSSTPACRRRASPISCSSTSRASRSTATATRRRLGVEAAAAPLPRRARRRRPRPRQPDRAPGHQAVERARRTRTARSSCSTSASPSCSRGKARAARRRRSRAREAGR